MSIFSAEKNVREDIRSAVPEFFSKLDKLIKEILGVKTNVSRLKTTQQSRDIGDDQNRSDRDVQDNTNERTTNEQSDIRTDFPSTDTNPSLAGNQTSISSNRANQSPRQLDNQTNEPINIRIKTDERFGTYNSRGIIKPSQNRSNRHVLSTDTTKAGSSQSISQTDTTSQNNARDTTTTQGNIFDAKSQTNEPTNIESTDKNGYETNLIKRIGSNAWVVTGFKKPKYGYGQGHGKTIPTEHQSYSARTGAGALDKDGTEDNQMVNQSGGATTSDLRTISPIRSRTDVGASDKSKDLVANMVATDFANDELTSNRSHKVSIDSLIQDI